MNHTDYTSVLTELAHTFPEAVILRDEPLAKHCSFRIGGPAAAVIQPAGADDLAAICGRLAQLGIEPFLLGNGTNMLFPDEGLDRIVIQTSRAAGGVSVDGDVLTAECGVTLARAATTARAAGLTGLEFAHGIPGSVGGGVVMNAGAYGGELVSVITETDYLDADMNTLTLRGEEHGFSYRHSFFSDNGGVVLRTRMRLQPGDPEAIGAKMKELADKRRASQPLELPSAGSTFKRPVGGFAAALIDEAGLKGYTVGGAQVSPKHAGFVVNIGGATCADVLALMDHIREVVAARSGITLEPEVRIIRG